MPTPSALCPSTLGTMPRPSALCTRSLWYTADNSEMQSIAWYARRLRAMSASEIGWRVRSGIRDAFDPYRVRLRLYPHTIGTQAAIAGAPRWCPVALGDWRDLAPDDPATLWRTRLLDRADRIVAHRLSFFDLEDVDLGDPIDWHSDHSSYRKD